jgi:hypothetical protein
VDGGKKWLLAASRISGFETVAGRGLALLLHDVVKHFSALLTIQHDKLDIKKTAVVQNKSNSLLKIFCETFKNYNY